MRVKLYVDFMCEVLGDLLLVMNFVLFHAYLSP